MPGPSSRHDDAAAQRRKSARMEDLCTPKQHLRPRRCGASLRRGIADASLIGFALALATSRLLGGSDPTGDSGSGSCSTGTTAPTSSAESPAASTLRIDPHIALDLLARHMWIADRLDHMDDGIEAAMRWDEDELLTDTYERFEAMAREAVIAETKRREDEQEAAGYGD